MPRPVEDEDIGGGGSGGDGYTEEMLSAYRCDIEELAKKKEAAKFGHEEAKQVYRWIEEFLRKEEEELSLGEPDETLSKLKDGVVLCRFLNILVGRHAVPKFERNPKNHMAERENIQRFLEGCLSALQLDAGEIFTIDCLHSAKTIPGVLKTMFAVGRQAQVLPGYDGPILGVRFTKSLERQHELREKKQQEAEKMREWAAKREAELCARVEAATVEQIKEELDRRKADELRNIERRRKKGRLTNFQYEKLIQELNQKYEELEKQGVDVDLNVQVTFGMDRDAQRKMQFKQSRPELKQEEEDLIDWLEELSGEDIEDVYETLKRGKLLFLIVKSIWGEKAVPFAERTKLTRSAGQAAAERENIKKYINICKALRIDCFNLEDLYSEKDRSAVMNNLRAMKRLYETRRSRPLAESVLVPEVKPNYQIKKAPVPVETTKTPTSTVLQEPSKIIETIIPTVQSITAPTPRRPSTFHSIARWTALLYLLAFSSFFVQFPQLWSSSGVQPIASYLQGVATESKVLDGSINYVLAAPWVSNPTLLWFSVSHPMALDLLVDIFCITGAIIAGLNFIFSSNRLFNGFGFGLMWLLYLSLRNVAQSFAFDSGFDDLLLEVGFVLIITLPVFNRIDTAPRSLTTKTTRPLVLSALRAILLRAVFDSGLRKLNGFVSNTNWWSVDDSENACSLTGLFVLSSRFLPGIVLQLFGVWRVITQLLAPIAIGLAPFTGSLFAKILALTEVAASITSGNIALKRVLIIVLSLALFPSKSTVQSRSSKTINGLVVSLVVLGIFASLIVGGIFIFEGVGALQSISTPEIQHFASFIKSLLTSAQSNDLLRQVFTIAFLVALGMTVATGFYCGLRKGFKDAANSRSKGLLVALGALILTIGLLAVGSAPHFINAGVPHPVSSPLSAAHHAVAPFHIVPSTAEARQMNFDLQRFSRIVLSSPDGQQTTSLPDQETAIGRLPIFVFDPSRLTCNFREASLSSPDANPWIVNLLSVLLHQQGAPSSFHVLNQQLNLNDAGELEARSSDYFRYPFTKGNPQIAKHHKTANSLIQEGTYRRVSFTDLRRFAIKVAEASSFTTTWTATKLSDGVEAAGPWLKEGKSKISDLKDFLSQRASELGPLLEESKDKAVAFCSARRQELVPLLENSGQFLMETKDSLTLKAQELGPFLEEIKVKTTAFCSARIQEIGSLMESCGQAMGSAFETCKTWCSNALESLHGLKDQLLKPKEDL